MPVDELDGILVNNLLIKSLHVFNVTKFSSVDMFQYCAVDKIEKNEMGGACSAVGEGRGVYRVLVGKPEGKRPLGRPRYRWEDNIRMDLQEVGYRGMDWIGLARDRDMWRALVNEVMNLRVQ
jgi:hypothetical protein